MTDQEQSLETVLTDYIKKEPVSFEQKTDDIGFEMSMAPLKSAFSKDTVTMAVGVASSGVISGVVAGILPQSLQVFAGIPAIITGLVGKITIGKAGIAKNYFDGVLISGVAAAISRFIPASFGQELSSKVQEEFKQEKPCQEQMKGDGIQW